MAGAQFVTAQGTRTGTPTIGRCPVPSASTDRHASVNADTDHLGRTLTVERAHVKASSPSPASTNPCRHRCDDIAVMPR